MEEDRPVTIADIAQSLGLSTATVSNVIHGKSNKVSAETARRVRQELERREYIPSMAGILLAQNDSKIIGVVINDHEKYASRPLEDGFICASLNALSREVDQAGFFLMVRTTRDFHQIPRFASMWNMVGLVLIGFCAQDYQTLRGQMRIPFVIYDGDLTQAEGLANLGVADFDGGRQMGRHLASLGHRKVLCIADNDTYLDHQRFLGLRQVLPQAQMLVVPMDASERRAFYRQQLEDIRTFTAVFALSDFYAADLMAFLQSAGVRVPEDMSIAGFDDSPISRMVCPSLTTVAQNHQARAKCALETLAALRSKDHAAPSRTLPVRLLVRESTGPCADSANLP